MRNSNEQTLGQVIKEILKKQHLQSKLTETRVKEAWEVVMGNVVAMRTTSIWVNEGRLTIKISSAPLKQELLFGKEKIKNLINENLGGDYIQEVVIQ